ncbi:divalent-cation tolerance protein CutA [Nocardia brevicatena]|uniref:divalent-cation tolerance protein CutA n=1 Tax=Nocardia brevicatena TaxID=37327 RepID=UPI0003029268|nr:divalent-cation tolerance protein CutA [Nocardia brevicatena]
MTTTTPTESVAKDIARAIVAERLAAGAEITGPATSVFWHLGELGESQEWRVTARTSAGPRDRLAERIAELHTWGNPEVTATEVPWCTDAYAAWVERTTASQEQAPAAEPRASSKRG